MMGHLAAAAAVAEGGRAFSVFNLRTERQKWRQRLKRLVYKLHDVVSDLRQVLQKKRCFSRRERPNSLRADDHTIQSFPNRARVSRSASAHMPTPTTSLTSSPSNR